MPLTKSDVFMNWEPVIFTPASGSAITLPEIKDLKEEVKHDVKYYSGGAAPGPRVKKLVNGMRSITISLADIPSAETIPFGVVGTLTAVLQDAENGGAPGGGATLFTWSNCSRDGSSTNGQHDDWGMVEITFSCTWGKNPDTGAYIDPRVITAV